MIEVEKKRAGKKFARSEAPMSFSDGSRILNHATLVMRMLGWAWRWAEHWVEHGSNWEPLLEEGQTEAKMTKKQLKIVDSTPESRAEDARRCRLAAFGAALRNRSFDTEDGFDNESLSKALNAVLHTSSLVGPLKEYEIEFFIDWLSRAYRSKSKMLGFGDDKIKVAKDDICVHHSDKSPKYELGNRLLPGKAALEPGQIFENKVEEPDDFLLPELLPDGSKCPYTPNCCKEEPKKEFKFRKPKPGEDDSSEIDEPLPKKTASNEAPESGNLSKKLNIAESKKRKAGRQPKKQEQLLSTASLPDSVAAMVPSAVKKRETGRRGRPLWTPAPASPQVRKTPAAMGTEKETTSHRKKLGLPVLRTMVEYQMLLEQKKEESVLRKLGRRGRPPRFLEFYTYLKVGGEEFNPNEYSSDEASDTNGEEDVGVGDAENAEIKTNQPVDAEDAQSAGVDAEGGNGRDRGHGVEPISDSISINAVQLATAEESKTTDEKDKPDALKPGGKDEEKFAVGDEKPNGSDADKSHRDELDNESNMAEPDSSVVESPKPKRSRMLSGLTSPIYEKRERDRRQTNYLDPSNSNKTCGATESKDESPIVRRRKRKKEDAIADELKKKGLQNNLGAARRSSRHSFAREMSLMEPDDSFTDDMEYEDEEEEEEEADLPDRKSKKRKSPRSSLGTAAKANSSPRPKRRGERPPKKKGQGVDNENEHDDDESFEPSNDADADDEESAAPPSDVEEETKSSDEEIERRRGRRSVSRNSAEPKEKATHPRRNAR